MSMKRGLLFLRRCECRIVIVLTFKQRYYAIKKIKTECGIVFKIVYSVED